MKFRWRKRPSATVRHLSVLMTFGLALPAAMSFSSPSLSIGARQPVAAVAGSGVRQGVNTVLAVAVIGNLLQQSIHALLRKQTVLY